MRADCAGKKGDKAEESAEAEPMDATNGAAAAAQEWVSSIIFAILSLCSFVSGCRQSLLIVFRQWF